MKTLIIFIVFAGALSACEPRGKDSVKEAHNRNLNSAIDEDISEFLTEAADARMMDIEQGKLAQTRGSTPAIRQYGELMIRDQERMLKELRTLAGSKNIALPMELSHEKAEGLEDLKEKETGEFDDTFVKMMKADHKRDVRDFEDATDLKDSDVKLFAESYLPVVKSHLEKIEAIEETSPVAEGNNN